MKNLPLHLTVGVVIIRNNKVLMVHHKKHDTWLFPGGHIEKNETPDDAAVREVKEETGLTFKFLQFGSLKYEYKDAKSLALPLHSNIHNVGDHNHYCFYYLGTCSSDEVKVSHESNDVKWFTESELDSLLLIPGIKKLAKLGFNSMPD